MYGGQNLKHIGSARVLAISQILKVMLAQAFSEPILILGHAL
jgi:hypothetical protein